MSTSEQAVFLIEVRIIVRQIDRGVLTDQEASILLLQRFHTYDQTPEFRKPYVSQNSVADHNEPE